MQKRRSDGRRGRGAASDKGQGRPSGMSRKNVVEGEGETTDDGQGSGGRRVMMAVGELRCA